MIDVGSDYRATLAVQTDTGTPITPVTATLTITTPDQATQVLTLAGGGSTAATPGALVADFPIVQEGLHCFAWQTTSPQIARSDYENARAYRAICSLADARDYLAISDTGRDDKIRNAIAAATKITEDIVGTCVIRTITGEWATGGFRDIIQVLRGPLVSETNPVTVASIWDGGPAWTLDNIAVNAHAGTLRLKSFLPFWFGPWRLGYTAGRTVIPENILNGFQEILWDLWAVQRGNLTDQTEPGLAEVEQFEAGAAGGAGMYRVPGRALECFGGDVRPGFG